MRPRPPVCGRFGLVLAGCLAAAGCSKNPTLVEILVHADDSVPAVTTLQITLTQAGAEHSGLYRSVIADTEAGTAPFHFPATVEFNFSGAADAPAALRLEALDASSVRHVVATGTGMVDVKPNHTVETDVTLSVSAVPPPADADAGAGAADAGAAEASDEPGSEVDAAADSSEDVEAADASDDGDDAL